MKLSDMEIKNILIEKRGFSLVELIASLTIAGILAAAVMTIVVTALNGFSLSREAAGVTQKANLALSRLRIELLNAEDIITAEDDRVVYTTDDGTFEILRTGNRITLEKTAGTTTIPAKTVVDNILAEYGTDKFLKFEKQGAAAWSTSDDFSELAAIIIKLKFSNYTDDLDTTVNPRKNRVRNAPLLVYGNAVYQIEHVVSFDGANRFAQQKRGIGVQDSRIRGCIRAIS
jgi:prepilin-type N-terminal cleavage/methylation domain-containing protein